MPKSQQQHKLALIHTFLIQSSFNHDQAKTYNFKYLQTH